MSELKTLQERLEADYYVELVGVETLPLEQLRPLLAALIQRLGLSVYREEKVGYGTLEEFRFHLPTDKELETHGPVCGYDFEDEVGGVLPILKGY